MSLVQPDCICITMTMFLFHRKVCRKALSVLPGCSGANLFFRKKWTHRAAQMYETARTVRHGEDPGTPPPGRDMVRCAIDISPGMLYTTLCALQGAGVTASRTQA